MIQRRTGCSPGRCVVRGVCSSFELRWILSRSVTYRRTDNLNSVFFVLTPERWPIYGKLKKKKRQDEFGNTAKLRFYLIKGRPYAFWVNLTPNGASRGYAAAGGPGFTDHTDTVGVD